MVISIDTQLSSQVHGICRAAAQSKGTDELLQHVQANARPVIARQIECVLKHWHALELDKSAANEEKAEIDDREDDDFQDAHTGVWDGLDEAESIHSWGDALYMFSLQHMRVGCSRPCKPMMVHARRVIAGLQPSLGHVRQPIATHCKWLSS